MDNNTPKEEADKTKTQRFNLKWSWGIIGGIFLGALGSGLWEKILSPTLLWLFEKASYLLNSISSNYMDSIYNEASNGFHEYYSFHEYLGFWEIVIFFYIYLLYILTKSNTKTLSKIVASINIIRLRKIFISLSIFVIMLSVFNISRTIYINNIITKTLSNIEIVSAVIEDKEYKMLKSKFHSMMNENDYLQLQKKITEIAEKHNLRLKK